MSRYIIENGKAKEVTERRSIIDGVAHLVVERYHIIGKVARLVWEYLKGYIFTSDRKAVKTKDGKIIKCKGQ